MTLSSNSKGAKIAGGIHFIDQHFRGLGETIEVVISQLDEDESLLFSSIPNIQFKWSESSIGRPTVLTVGYDQNRDNHRLKQLFIDELILPTSLPTSSSLSNQNIDYKQIHTLSRKVYATIIKTVQNARYSIEPYFSSDHLGFNNLNRLDNNNFNTLQSGVKFIYDCYHNTNNNNNDNDKKDNKFNIQVLYDFGARITSFNKNSPYNQLQVSLDDYTTENSLLYRLGTPLLPIVRKFSNSVIGATVTVTKPILQLNHMLSTAIFSRNIPNTNTTSSPTTNNNNNVNTNIKASKKSKNEILTPSLAAVVPIDISNNNVTHNNNDSKNELIAHNQKKIKM